MTKLIFLSGTMGVGKTTIAQKLKKELTPSVFLDGDWCWDMTPFQVTETTKSMVLDNIAFQLNSFIAANTFDYIIFCWVMHETQISQDILSRIQQTDYELTEITLTVTEAALTERLQKDVDAGIRQPDVIERSLQRLALYHQLPTHKIDVSALSIGEAVTKIKTLIQK